MRNLVKLDDLYLRRASAPPADGASTAKRRLEKRTIMTSSYITTSVAVVPGPHSSPTMIVPTDLLMLVDQLDATFLVSLNVIRLSVARMHLAALVGSAISVLGGDAPIHIDVPIHLRRRGHELLLIYAVPDVRPAQTDDRLIILIANGWRAWNTLTKGPRIADATKRSHLVRLGRLRFLAPDIVTAIIEGRQPVELTARSLLRIADLPTDWVERRCVLGF
jgi:site-specific DNA recombinase